MVRLIRLALTPTACWSSSRHGKYMLAVNGEKNMLHAINHVIMRRSALVKTVYGTAVSVLEMAIFPSMSVMFCAVLSLVRT